MSESIKAVIADREMSPAERKLEDKILRDGGHKDYPKLDWEIDLVRRWYVELKSAHHELLLMTSQVNSRGLYATSIRILTCAPMDWNSDKADLTYYICKHDGRKSLPLIEAMISCEAFAKDVLNLQATSMAQLVEML